jgi:leucyl aminopeptidase
MKVRVALRPVGDLRIVGVFEKEKKAGVPSYFEGKLGQAAVIDKKIIVGLGEKKKFDLEAVRTAAAAAIRKAKEAKAKIVASELIGKGLVSTKDSAQAMAEGAVLADYQYQEFKKEKKESPIKELIIIEKDKDAQKGAKIGEILANAANDARDLVNGPSNAITPTYMANYASKMARKYGLSCKILDPKKEGMESLWAVAKGSKEPPKVVVLRHKGSGPLIGLIGKGITFDSGGINIKSSNRLWEMKTDMAGAAAVMLAMRAVSELKINKNIIAVIPLTENMPDGGALKPGDVVSSLEGTSVEVTNTDAEGRMILADAITYAKKQGAQKIFDCATLTGGCVVALGDVASGLLGNDDKLMDGVKAAAKKSGEKVWPLPLYEEYKEYLKSDLADIKNCMDKGMASPSTGATFLHMFIGDTPWAHLDIAGTAYLSKPRGYLSEGATGIPLRTVVEWLLAG